MSSACETALRALWGADEFVDRTGWPDHRRGRHIRRCVCFAVCVSTRTGVKVADPHAQ